MKYEDKTKQQLIDDLIALQQRNSELEVLLNRANLAKKEYQSSSFLQSILDGIQDEINIIDRNMNILYANQIMEVNYKHGQPLVGQKCYVIYKNRSEPCENCICEAAFREGKPNNIILQWTNPQGKPVWLEKRVFPLIDEYGEVIAVISHARDITERTLAEEKTNKIKRQLHNIIESLPDATFVIDEQKKVIAWNRAIEDMTGIRKEDIIGKGDYIYAIPFYGKPEPILIDHIMIKSKQLENRYENVIQKDNLLCAETFHPHKDNGQGIYLWAMASLLFDDNKNIIGAIESIRDITDRKRLEDDLLKHRHKLEELVIERTRELQATNELLRFEIAERKKADHELTEKTRILELLFRHSFSCIAILDRSFNYIQVNESFAKHTEHDVDYFAGKNHFGLYPSDSEPIFKNAIQIKTPYQAVASPCKSDPEHTTYWDWTLVPILDSAGEVELLFLSLNDVTERVMAEKVLRSSEERFYKAFQSSPNPMAIISFNQQYIDINDAYSRTTGYSRAELIGRTPTELNRWVRHEERQQYRRVLKEQGWVRNLEVRMRTKSGGVQISLLSAEIIELDNTKCILATINDITEYKQLEKEMARFERLNLIGEMAAGIGHEIRNPMTVVRGLLQILLHKENCLEYKDYFDIMIDELDRANSIITEFLTLAKIKSVNLTEQDLNRIIDAISPLITADAMASDKYVEIQLGSIPNLLLDEKEIRQLILNLTRNALESMNAGGKLSIKTYYIDGLVVMSIQDQGSGIKEEDLEKLGTPFFTTKDNGTGLGLAVCYSIAERHNASVKVQSTPAGTTFFVEFRLSY